MYKMVDRTLKSLQFPQISNVRYLIPQHNLLLYDEIPGTTQSYVYTGSTLTGVLHKQNGTTIRTDSFTFTDNSIVETRTLSTGETITITTNLVTLDTVIS